MPVQCDLNGWWPPGCGLVSSATDGVMGSLAAMLASFLENIASWIWSFISGAFSVSDIQDSSWVAVKGLTDWWVGVMMTPLVVVIILQLLSGLISQQPRRIWRALIGGFIAVPSVAAAVYLVQQLTRVTDAASVALLDTLGKDPYVVFMRLFGFERAPEGSGREWNLVSMVSPGTSQTPLIGGLIITVLATLIVWLLAFILMCSMIFRSFALIVLAAMAPVALMVMPWEKTKSWAGRWCEIVVALLLAKPLAATVLAVAINLFAHSTSFAGLAAGTVGMLLACAAPLMTLRLVSFAGGELAAAAQSAGGGQMVQRAGSFTSRQIGRQLGHKLTLTGRGHRAAVMPVPSSKAPMPTRVLPVAPGRDPAPSISKAVEIRAGGAATTTGGPAPTTHSSGPAGKTMPASPVTRPGNPQNPDSPSKGGSSV